jgi:hypothetical protein
MKAECLPTVFFSVVDLVWNRFHSPYPPQSRLVCEDPVDVNVSCLYFSAAQAAVLNYALFVNFPDYLRVSQKANSGVDGASLHHERDNDRPIWSWKI